MEDTAMTELRKRMIQDMYLAGLTVGTQKNYVWAVRLLAAHYHIPPDQLTEGQVRDYLVYLREVKGIAKGTFQLYLSSMKFLYLNTLGYDWPLFTKKKSGYPDRNAFPTHGATRTVAA
jgi:integrase/recombinase XerD